MNKVTLSVAAIAAVGVPVQAQAADQTREQIIDDVNKYIDEAKALIDTYNDVKGVETNPASYLSKINAVKANFAAWLADPANANTAIDAQSWKAQARAVVDLAAADQKPYDVKNGLLENWNAANAAYTTAQNNLNLYNVAGDAASLDFYNKKLPVLQAYMNNAITEEKPGLTALQTKINAYNPADPASTLIDDAAGIRAQLAGIKAALEFEFSSWNLSGAFNANNNENAYKAIVDQVANANTAIDNVFDKIRALYPQESVYGDWYKEAYDALGKWRQEVARVEQYNKQCYDAGTAVRDDAKGLENYDINSRDITKAISKINEIYSSNVSRKDVQETANDALVGATGTVSTALAILNGHVTNLHKQEIGVTVLDSRLNNIITQLTNLKTAIATSYANHTVAADKTKRNGFDAQYSGITTDLKYSDLCTRATDIYNDKLAYNEIIAEMVVKTQTLDAKVTAAKVASTAYPTYNPAAHFITEENEIRNSLIGNDLTVGTSVLKFAQTQWNETVKKIGNQKSSSWSKYVTIFKNDGKRNANGETYSDLKLSIDTKTTAYATNTAAAKTAYEAAQKKYDDNLMLLNELKKVATDLNVTIDGQAGKETVSYGVFITTVEGELNSIKGHIDNALATNYGVSHKTFLDNANAVVVESNIEEVTKTYNHNSINYAQNIKLAAAEEVLATVGGNLDDLATRVKKVSDDLAAGKYGEQTGTLACTLAVNINTSITTIKGGNANLTGLTALTTEFDGIETAYNNIDKSTSENVASKVAKAEEISGKNADWTAKVNSLTNLVVEIEKAAAAAEANLAAYNAVKDMASATAIAAPTFNVKNAVDAARTYIQNTVYEGVYSGNAGYNHFNGILTAIETSELATLRGKIETSYKNGTMVKDSEEQNYSKQLNDLKDKANQQSNNAYNNKNAYDNQRAAFDGVRNSEGVLAGGLQQYYDKVYDIVKKDQTSNSAKMLEMMATEKTNMETLDALIESKYGEGKSFTDKETIEASHKAIDDKIREVEGIASQWKDQLLKDNQKEHQTSFLDGSFAAAKKEFDNAVDLLNKFSSIKNEALQTAMASLVAEHQYIFNYADKLRQLKAEEAEAFANHNQKELYVATAFINKANEFAEDIKSKKEAYADAVNQEAWNNYSGWINDAFNDITTAQNYINTSYHSATVKANAFSSVKSMVDEILTAAGGKTGNTISPVYSYDKTKVDLYFAYKVDGVFEKLERTVFTKTLDGLKQQAAENEFNDIYTQVCNSYTAEREFLVAQTDIDASGYIRTIDNYKKNHIDAQKTAFDRNGTTFTGVVAMSNDLWGYYSYWDTDEKAYHSQAYKDAKTDLLNLNYKGQILDMIAQAETRVDAVAETLNKLFAAHIDGSQTAAALKAMYNQLDIYKEQCLTWTSLGGLMNTVSDYVSKTGWGTLAYAIDGAKTTAKNEEFNTLLYVEIERIKEQYNNAIKDLGVDWDKDKAIDNQISDLSSEIWNCPDGFDGAYTFLLAFEKKIADLSYTINKDYQPKALEQAKEVLDAKSAEVVANIAAIRAKVDEIPAVKDYYNEDVSDLEAWLDYVNADIEAKFAANTLTFYKANLLKDFERILNNSEDLLTGSGNLQANYNKYVNNEAQHTAMLSKVASIVETYNAVKELVYALEFDYEVASNDTYVDGKPKMISWKDKQTLEVIDPLLKALNTKIANDYANIAINDAAKNGISSTSIYNTDVNNINNKIKAFEMNGKYYEATNTYLDNLYETLVDIQSRINTKRYTSTTRRSLLNRRSELVDAYNNACIYNDDAYYSGKLIWDIDGNQLATNTNDNPNGTPIWTNKVSIDYSADAWYVLQAKVAELQEIADQLYQDADDMSYKLGDVDHDGKITVVDYARVRNMILCAVGYDDIEEEAVKFAADANEDKLIDVADLSAISYIIFGPNATSSRAALFASDFSAENKISAAIESEETTIFGKTVRMAVNVESGVAFTAGQFDVKLPAGMKLVGASVSERGNGHEVLTGDLENGMKRVVVSVVENNSFYGNSGTLVYLDVEVASDFNGGNIELSDAIFTDGRANSYRLTNNGPVVPTGIDGVEAATAKERIYSVGGQMMKAVKKGLNIIVGENNKTQKVVNNK